MDKLIVCGGTGFLGRAICKAAIQRNSANVVASVSRRGTPPASEGTGSWAYDDRMEWISSVASSFETVVREAPERVDAVVCSVGALLENENYKQVLERAENVSPFIGRGSEASYTALNRDVCIRAIDDVENYCVSAGEPTDAAKRIPFVFISAHAAPPGVDMEYIRSKREAEEYLLGKSDVFRPIIFRPSFMYGESRPSSMHIAMGLKTANAGGKFLKTFLSNSPVPGLVNSILQASGGDVNFDFVKAPPLHTGQVAQAVLNAVEDTTVEGIFDPMATLQMAGRART